MNIQKVFITLLGTLHDNSNNNNNKNQRKTKMAKTQV